MLQQQSHEEPASVPEVQRPTVGRIVHYVLAEGDAPNPLSVGEVRPAIVTGVYDDDPYAVALSVFLRSADGDSADGPVVTVPEARHHDPARVEGDPANYDTGTWHWPPRI